MNESDVRAGQKRETRSSSSFRGMHGASASHNQDSRSLPKMKRFAVPKSNKDSKDDKGGQGGSGSKSGKA